MNMSKFLAFALVASLVTFSCVYSLSLGATETSSQSTGHSASHENQSSQQGSPITGVTGKEPVDKNVKVTGRYLGNVNGYEQVSVPYQQTGGYEVPVTQSYQQSSYQQPSYQQQGYQQQSYVAPVTQSYQQPIVSSYEQPIAQTYQQQGYQQQSYQQPSYQQQSYVQPIVSTPSYQQPIVSNYSTPSYQQQSYVAPVTQSYQQPSYVAPITQSYQQPSYQQSYVQPIVSTPSYQQPIVSNYSTPSYQQQSYVAPVTQSYQQPSYQQQSYVQPITPTYETQSYQQPIVSSYQQPSYQQQSYVAPVTQSYQQPIVSNYSTPSYSTPSYTAPVTQSYQQPSYQQQSYVQPITPTYETQSYQQPIVSSYQQSSYQQPIVSSYQQPSYQQQSYVAPVTQSYQQSSYQQPSYQQQSYVAPVQSYGQQSYGQQSYGQQSYVQPYTSYQGQWGKRSLTGHEAAPYALLVDHFAAASDNKEIFTNVSSIECPSKPSDYTCPAMLSLSKEELKKKICDYEVTLTANLSLVPDTDKAQTRCGAMRIIKQDSKSYDEISELASDKMAVVLGKDCQLKSIFENKTNNKEQIFMLVKTSIPSGTKFILVDGTNIDLLDSSSISREELVNLMKQCPRST